MQRRTRIAIAWAPALVYMAAIWIASSMSLGPLPLDEMPFRDKGIHFLEFAGLAFLLAHAVMSTWPEHLGPRTFGVAVLIAAAWGVLDEIHQAFVPGRSPDALDIVADTLGATVGAFARHALHVAVRARRRA